MSALLSVLDQTIELCARHKEALAEIVRLREERDRLLRENAILVEDVANLKDEIRLERAE